MPFKKTAPNRYVSPSGRVFTTQQVVAYYATKGFTRPVRTDRRAVQKAGRS